MRLIDQTSRQTANEHVINNDASPVTADPVQHGIVLTEKGPVYSSVFAFNHWSKFFRATFVGMHLKCIPIAQVHPRTSEERDGHIQSGILEGVPRETDAQPISNSRVLPHRSASEGEALVLVDALRSSEACGDLANSFGEMRPDVCASHPHIPICLTTAQISRPIVGIAKRDLA